MFSSKFIVHALAMAASASAAALSAAVAQSAAIAQSASVAATAATAASVATVTAAVVDARAIQASPSIILCSGSLNPQNGCITIPVVSDTCTSFTGGLSFLDQTVSNAQIPAGFVCTFFSAFGCSSSSANDRVVLTGGAWSFFNVPGNNGNENFNDMASSFSCSAI